MRLPNDTFDKSITNYVWVVSQIWLKDCRTSFSTASTTTWQIVGLFIMPCGRTTQWYCCVGLLLLIESTENAKWAQSSQCKKILKKQSFKSRTERGQSSGIIAGLGTPGCSGPIGLVTAFIACRSCNNLTESCTWHHFYIFNFPFSFGGHQISSIAGAEQLCLILHSCCWSSQSLPVFGGDHLGELHFSPIFLFDSWFSLGFVTK